MRRFLRHTVIGAFLFWLWTSHGRLAYLLREQAGAVGDVTTLYAASANEATVTALNSLASSTTWLAGWESTAIDNTTTKYLDFRVTAKITAGTTLTAGELRLYLVGMLDDSTWPDVFDGTSSAETVTSAGIRDAICKLGASSATSTTNSVVYYLDCPSVAAVFGGCLPKKFVVFITHSMVGALAASGNQLTYVGVYANVAQS
jgi:hypothetical protein